MLAHLRQRVEDVLAPVQTANLSTSGPAGIQSRVFPCEAVGMWLYLLVPGTSDHLFNLEHEPTAVVSTKQWQLHGRGCTIPLSQAPPTLSLPHSPDAPGCVLVKIQPMRLQINQPQGWGNGETIDITD
ncbi:MAG TPA: hypothetical protein PLD25_01550 [Chloroflexota bacterium]|nr:hypothetical protein [Chloroflexota bacterium]HUM71205.1 hypothetical protein [Chloroflexota bacterium]